jgi:hypothetical protein
LLLAHRSLEVIGFSKKLRTWKPRSISTFFLPVALSRYQRTSSPSAKAATHRASSIHPEAPAAMVPLQPEHAVGAGDGPVRDPRPMGPAGRAAAAGGGGDPGNGGRSRARIAPTAIAR